MKFHLGLIAATLVLSVASFAPAAHASAITYTYTGNPFTTLGNGYQCTLPGLCGISGSFTVATALAANLNYSLITPQSYSFSDGQQIYSDTNSTVGQIAISTDASGAIDGWGIDIEASGDWSNYIMSTGGGGADPVMDMAHDSSNSPAPTPQAYNFYDPGTWTQVAPTVTPEPSTWVLLTTGALALLGLAWRRHSAAGAA